ncbi:MAG: nuclear transport factor 2 family protein [Pseudomonadota bacterium]|nr:nuclear transport factor 2 family protein [Pseudomonadota bacterium]
MAQDRLNVIHSMYDAFGNGDMDRVAALIAETHWEEAEGMPYGGRYQGADEIFQNVFGRIVADVENFSVRPDEILPVEDDRVLGLGRYKGKGRSGDLDVAFAHLWTVRDGKNVKFVQYADTHKYREACALPGV